MNPVTISIPKLHEFLYNGQHSRGALRMADYRIYRLDARGHIEAAEWIEAETDAAAVALARAKEFPAGCELWDGGRLIAAFAGATGFAASS